MERIPDGGDQVESGGDRELLSCSSLCPACDGSGNSTSTRTMPVPPEGDSSGGGESSGGVTSSQRWCLVTVGAWLAGGSASSSGAGSPQDGGNFIDGGLWPEAGPGTTAAVNVHTASAAILAMSGISTVPTSAVTGNLGVSPAAATYITGFSLTSDPSDVFATSPQVTGNVSR